MHQAPPVSYPVGRSLGVGLATLFFGVAGVAAMATWAWRGGAGVGLAGVLAALVLACWALWCWARAPAGVLSWDGQAWRWSARAGASGLLKVRLDFQGLLLVQWQPPPAPVEWLWLERRADPQRWADLRRAVYSRANPDALPEADSPAANP
jgi:hypothetical protein